MYLLFLSLLLTCKHLLLLSAPEDGHNDMEIPSSLMFESYVFVLGYKYGYVWYFGDLHVKWTDGTSSEGKLRSSFPSYPLIFPAVPTLCWGSVAFFVVVTMRKFTTAQKNAGVDSPLGKQSSNSRPQSPVWGWGTECLTLVRRTGQGVPAGVVLAVGGFR